MHTTSLDDESPSPATDHAEGAHAHAHALRCHTLTCVHLSADALARINPLTALYLLVDEGKGD